MALNNKPLWIQLAKKGLKKIDVIAMAGLTTNVMAQMGKNKQITLKNLERICKALNCIHNYVRRNVEGTIGSFMQKYISLDLKV